MAAERGQGITRVLMLVLLLIFALSALLTAAFGVKVFRSVSAGSDANYALRASMAYVAGKVHAMDTAGFLSVEEFGETRALALSEEIDGLKYHTYIYLYEGSLCELFTVDGFSFQPEAGIPLVAVSEFSFELAEGALSLTATAATGETRQSRVLIRTGGGR